MQHLHLPFTRHRKLSLWAVFLLCLFGVLLVTPAFADKIILKSGETVVGEILSETDDAIQIKVSRAGGTIFATQTISRDAIATIERDTPEQKAQRAMESAYREAKSHQLSPDRSKPLAEYDRVINDVFGRFLNQFPNSPHAQEIEGLRASWQEERDRAASGAVKNGGQWLTGEDAGRVLAQWRVEQLLREASALRAKQQYEAAAPKFREALSFHQLATLPLLETIQQQQLQFYNDWAQALELQLQQARLSLASAERNLASANNALVAAQQKLAADEAAKTAREREMIEGDGGVRRMGDDFALMQSRIAVSNLQKQFEAVTAQVAQQKTSVTAAEDQLTQLRNARDVASFDAQQIIAAKSQALAAVAPPVPELSTPQVTPQEIAKPVEQPQSVTAPPAPVAAQPPWWEKHWYWILIGIVVLVVIYKLIPSAN